MSAPSRTIVRPCVIALSAIGEPITAERVRAHVDDAHHVRARAPVESAAADLGAQHGPIMLRCDAARRAWRGQCPARPSKAMARSRSRGIAVRLAAREAGRPLRGGAGPPRRWPRLRRRRGRGRRGRGGGAARRAGADRRRRRSACPRPAPRLAELAAEFYGRPSRQLKVAGVTGTDGKTTTTHMAEHVLQASGIVAGAMSTVAYSVGGAEIGQHSAARPRSRRRRSRRGCRRMVDAGVAVRGHRDHVARARPGAGRRVRLRRRGVHQRRPRPPRLPRDVGGLPRGEGAAHRPDRAARPTRESRRRPSSTATTRATSACRAGRSRAAGRTASRPPRTSIRSSSSMTRRGLALPPEDAARRDGRDAARAGALQRLQRAVRGRRVPRARRSARGRRARAWPSFEGVRGRLERVDLGQDFRVFIDFAHSAGALASALAELRPFTQGPAHRRLRLHGTLRPRPPGHGARGGAVLRLLHHHDRRSAGARTPSRSRATCSRAPRARRQGCDYEIVIDRRAAIRRAIELARPGDTVLLAGKGHERSMRDGGRFRAVGRARRGRGRDQRAAGALRLAAADHAHDLDHVAGVAAIDGVIAPHARGSSPLCSTATARGSTPEPGEVVEQRGRPHRARRRLPLICSVITSNSPDRRVARRRRPSKHSAIALRRVTPPIASTGYAATAREHDRCPSDLGERRRGLGRPRMAGARPDRPEDDVVGALALGRRAPLDRVHRPADQRARRAELRASRDADVALGKVDARRAGGERDVACAS